MNYIVNQILKAPGMLMLKIKRAAMSRVNYLVRGVNGLPAPKFWILQSNPSKEGCNLG